MSVFDIGSRNNTSFTQNLQRVLVNINENKNDYLRYHQRLVTEYVMKYDGIRGILIYHNMGSGKTLLSVNIAETLLNTSNYRRVIFISPKSLHENFKKDFNKYAKMNQEVANKFSTSEFIDSHINKYYSFVSLNASNMFEQVKRTVNKDDILNIKDDSLILDEDLNKKSKDLMFSSLDNCVIVWDEFHNFLNSVSNGSKNAVQLYDLVMLAKNVKLIGMTGTPIVNDPYEIAIGFNMLAGYIRTNNRNIETLFGEDYTDFHKNFILNSQAVDIDTDVKLRPNIKNKDKFQDRILGLVSYYGADTPEFKKMYPVELNLIVKRIKMSGAQFAAYITARDKELEESKRGIFTEKRQRLKKPSGASSSYRVRSRQLSNFLYPDYASRRWQDDKNIDRYEKFIDKLNDDCFTIEGLKKWSPKLLEMLTQCSMHLPSGILKHFKPDSKQMSEIIKRRTEVNKGPLEELKSKTYSFGIGPGLVYSQFLDSGVGLFAKALLAHGMTQLESSANSAKKVGEFSGTFAIISGDVDPEIRAELIKVFNNPSNKDGSILSLLLITSTGAEGISLERGRHIHLMEPYWHWARIRQVITRIIRLGSHMDLEEKERFVQPYIYLSDYPSIPSKSDTADKIMQTEPTTDITLFEKAVQNQQLINKFLEAIQEASIDCLIHYNEGKLKKNCRSCKPTNRQLWYPNLDKDIQEKSPCEGVLIAQSITVIDESGKHEYNYVKSGDTIRLFEPTEAGHVEIFDDHPNYDNIIEEILKIEK